MSVPCGLLDVLQRFLLTLIPLNVFYGRRPLMVTSPCRHECLFRAKISLLSRVFRQTYTDEQTVADTR